MTLTPEMERVLRHVIENGFAYAGKHTYNGQFYVRVTASTLHALERRQLVCTGINPDGGMQATPAPNGVAYYQEKLQDPHVLPYDDTAGDVS